jgi:hypothetical protein
MGTRVPGTAQPMKNGRAEEESEKQSSKKEEAGAEGTVVSGTGVPGVRSDHPDTLPPDEEGVSEAERTDDTGDDGWTARPGRPPRGGR